MGSMAPIRSTKPHRLSEPGLIPGSTATLAQAKMHLKRIAEYLAEDNAWTPRLRDTANRWLDVFSAKRPSNR